jgi:hypothetical protein
MATLSVREIAHSCLGRDGDLSIREHVFGVHGINASATRSLGDQLRLVRSAPFIRLAIVTIRPVGSTAGPDVRIQRDLDVANEVWQRTCGTWIYCVASVVERTNLLGTGGILDQMRCPLGVQQNPTQEEQGLFALGRTHGADVVEYYITGATNSTRIGCAAYPAGRRGFWVAFGSSANTLGHELTHVIGLNPHVGPDPEVNDDDQDNLMWPTPRAITHLPPDLRTPQRNRVRGDDGLESCPD